MTVELNRELISDLGLLKRDKNLQKRYMAWTAGMKQEYGSIGEILIFDPKHLQLLIDRIDDSELFTEPSPAMGKARYTLSSTFGFQR